MTASRILLIAALLVSPAAHAQARTYAGTFSSNWQTVGKHGHDQPWCAEPVVTEFPGGFLIEGADCNHLDFARANLDNSIGFRTGRERDLVSVGPLSIVAGVEAAIASTEYNLSQNDFMLATVAGVGGIDVHLGPVSAGGRYGFGPFATTDRNEAGFHRFHGYHVTLPLRAGAAIRISQRSMRVLDFSMPDPAVPRREPQATETSVLLVASPEYTGLSNWEFSASSGTTMPGAGSLGSSRHLRHSTYTQISVFRDLPWKDLQARLSWSSSAHESQLSSVFLGYDGNYRSKTIDGFALGVSQTRPLGRFFSVRYGSGIEVADWRDEHQLLTRDRQPLVAGIETAIAAGAALRWHAGANLAIETSFEKVYWRRLDLGEGRLGFGLVVTK